MKTVTLKNAPNGVGIRGQRPTYLSTNMPQDVAAEIVANPQLLCEPGMAFFKLDLSEAIPEDAPEGAYIDYALEEGLGQILIHFNNDTGAAEFAIIAVNVKLPNNYFYAKFYYAYWDEESSEEVRTQIYQVQADSSGALIGTTNNYSGDKINLEQLINAAAYTSGNNVSPNGVIRWFNVGGFKVAAFAPGFAITAIENEHGTDSWSFEVGKATGVNYIMVKTIGVSSPMIVYSETDARGNTRTHSAALSNGLSDVSPFEFMVVATPADQSKIADGDPDAFHRTWYNGLTENSCFLVPKPAHNYDTECEQNAYPSTQSGALSSEFNNRPYTGMLLTCSEPIYFDSLLQYLKMMKDVKPYESQYVKALAAGSNTVGCSEDKEFGYWVNNTGSDATVTVTSNVAAGGYSENVLVKVCELERKYIEGFESANTNLPLFTKQYKLDAGETKQVTVPNGSTLFIDVTDWQQWDPSHQAASATVTI